MSQQEFDTPQRITTNELEQQSRLSEMTQQLGALACETKSSMATFAQNNITESLVGIFGGAVGTVANAAHGETVATTGFGIILGASVALNVIGTRIKIRRSTK